MQFLIDIGLSIVYFCIFLLLCAWTWRFWMMYVNQKFINSMEWVMLEIKLPRDIDKSPLATEMALATLLQGGGISNKHALWFKGGLPAYSSLEIASLEGVVHFYVRILTKYRPLVESNFYAQYPGIEIVEADDYTKAIRYHHLTKDVKMWGASFRTAKSWKPINPETGKPYSKTLGEDKEPKVTEDKGDEYSMKADFLPIKTYVDYELNKDPKEEYKIDPIAPLLEVMGSVTKGEYFWYQILVQDESVYNGSKMPKFYVNERTHKHLSLKEMVDQYKRQIRTSSKYNMKDAIWTDEFGNPKLVDSFTKKADGTIVQNFDIKKDKDGNEIKIPKKVWQKYAETAPSAPKKEMDLTADEKDQLELINKKLSKPLALCHMRFLYITKSENFNPAHINSVLSMPKAFAGENSFAPSPSEPYNYPWQDIGKKRSSWRTEEMFEEYVEREGFFPHLPSENDGLQKMMDNIFWTFTMKQRKVFHMVFEAIFHPFNHPQADQAFTLNLEELATLWHLPGATVATPTLPRIDSVKGVAPVNLPI